METKINVSEFRLKEVNFNLFFDYLAINLNDVNGYEFSDFYNLFKNIKNNKYKNILADFYNFKNESDLLNFCYNFYNNYNYNLTLIYNRENILINIKYSKYYINLIIKQEDDSNVNDYLDYEAEMLNNA